MYLIVGLGNPGDKFIHTRHNLGFQVLDHLKHKLASSVQPLAPGWEKEEKFKSEIIKTTYNLQLTTYQLILVRPQTYMNLSGMAVAKIAKYFKIKPENIIIVHDELDLLLGHIKVKMGGSGAGHHGIESVIKYLGTEQFIRVRMGIGNEAAILGEHKRKAFSAEHFVVEEFTLHEKSKVKAMVKRATTAIETILKEGIEKAQNQFN